MATNAALQPGYARVTHVVPEGSAPSGAFGEPVQQGNIITRKLGPLPLWAWVAIGAGLIWFLRRGSSSQQSGTLASGPSPVSSGITQDPVTSSDAQALLQALTNLNGTLASQKGSGSSSSSGNGPTNAWQAFVAWLSQPGRGDFRPGKRSFLQWSHDALGEYSKESGQPVPAGVDWNWLASMYIALGGNPKTITVQQGGKSPRAGTITSATPSRSYYVVPRTLQPSPFPQNLISGQHATRGINPGPHTATQPSRSEGWEEHPRKSARAMFVPPLFIGAGYRAETIENTVGGKNLGSPSAQGMVTMQRKFVHLSKGTTRRRHLQVQTGLANRPEKTTG